MYEFFIVRITNRQNGTAGKTITEFETESEALKEFFRQDRKSVV